MPQSSTLTMTYLPFLLENELLTLMPSDLPASSSQNDTFVPLSLISEKWRACSDSMERGNFLLGVSDSSTDSVTVPLSLYLTALESKQSTFSQNQCRSEIMSGTVVKMGGRGVSSTTMSV
mmetsp:Transcript_7335/g.10170  ORF Transcript_7335/g.10170 Transcript_7335/m.10170 type:complete len:120 (-) Transcript_7335:1130-1489(-)